MGQLSLERARLSAMSPKRPSVGDCDGYASEVEMATAEKDQTTTAVRRRRAQSVTRAQDITAKEKKTRAGQVDNPCHEPKDSLLSSSSGYNNYRGLLNLCIVLLVLSNARVALENIIKYGILVDPVQWFKVFFWQPSSWPSVLILLSLNIYILLSFAIEIAFSKNKLSEKKGRILTIINMAAIVIIPGVMVFVCECHPVGSSFALGIVSTVFLKLVSYHMVNYWCREYRNGEGKTMRRRRSFSMSGLNKPNGVISTPLVTYPDNLNLKDLYYFMFAPTLCYELNFPRSERIRKRFLIKRIIEMFLLLQLILGLVQQWMVPTINNSLKPLQEMNIGKMIERLLKLAVPNHLIWLLFFYWFFHSCLNAIAEVLRFADREFYRDWWNSESVNYFWANWNIPVHKWCVRHVYKPLLMSGFTKLQGSTVVFFISAFFHEYLVSVPLHLFRIWAFSGMLSQLPFAMFVSRYLHNHYGNMAVWISLIIGQPLCILMYYHDYYVIHYGSGQ